MPKNFHIKNGSEVVNSNNIGHVDTRFFFATILITVFGLLMFTSNNVPVVYADTNVESARGIGGSFTITQEGTAKLKSSQVLTSEHAIALKITGNYDMDSTVLKMDRDSLSGSLIIDNGQPVMLDIQRIGTYKNMKTLFYKATFADQLGSISGKLTFTSPINFESDGSQTISVGAITMKLDSARYYAKTTTGEISIQSAGAISNMACDKSLWDHVYHPNRLQVVDSCKTVSGVIEAKISEKDGDYHIRLKLDPQYSDLINQINIEKQHGDLVIEPICQHGVTQTDAISACQGFSKHIEIPPVGTHVKVTGTYVLDLQHGGWAEIHPVTSMEILEN